MKKILETLFCALPIASLATSIWCFFKMMFYINVPKQTEVAFYVALGIMSVYAIGFFIVSDDSDVEY